MPSLALPSRQNYDILKNMKSFKKNSKLKETKEKMGEYVIVGY